MTDKARQEREVVVLQKLAKSGRIDKKWADRFLTAYQKETYGVKTRRGMKGGRR